LQFVFVVSCGGAPLLLQALLNKANGTQGWYSVDADGNPDPSQIVPHFVDFADICFSRFGDRVK
jgi:hypothetical protein